jgi:type VI secretion system protein ImpA
MSEGSPSAVNPVLDVDRLLAPISGDAPAGTDVRYDAAFDKLKNLRREAEAIEQRPREPDEEAGARTSAVLSAWATIADQAVEILAGRAKDLQVALWLLEALSRLEGFRGGMTGLHLLSGMVETYWDGFFPNVDPEDDEPLGFRAGLMTWLDERLPTVLKTAPVSAPPDSYALIHYESTQKTGDERKALLADGWPTTEQFDAALKNSSLQWLEQAIAEIAACREGLEALARVCDERMVSRRTLPNGNVRVDTLLSFGRLRETLDTAHWLVEKAAKPKRPATAASATASAAVSADPSSSNGAPPGATLPGADGGWLEARELVRRNQVDGLRALEARLRDAGSGRDRFLRKLEFADVCLEAGMYALAYPLYDDVTRTIVDRTLMEWEDRTLLLRAWKGLAECCEKLTLLLPNTESRGREAADQIRTLTES